MESTKFELLANPRILERFSKLEVTKNSQFKQLPDG